MVPSLADNPSGPVSGGRQMDPPAVWRLSHLVPCVFLLAELLRALQTAGHGGGIIPGSLSSEVPAVSGLMERATRSHQFSSGPRTFWRAA